MPKRGRLDWISRELGMGTRAGCCRLIYRMRAGVKNRRRLARQREAIRKMPLFHA